MKKILFILMACLITGYSCDARAQMGGVQGDACSADQKKYCAGIERGPQMGECLDKNMARLSRECRAAHKQIKTNMAKGLMPGHPLSGCRQDIQNLCASVDTDMGPVMECLMRNESRLSDGCRTKLRDVPPPPGHS